MPQLPRAFCADEHRVEILRKAVVGNDWATEPLSQIAMQGLNSQWFYEELEASLNLSKEAKLAVLHDSMTKPISKSDNELLGVFYQG